MTNTRTRSDIATMDRRETADHALRDNRARNDELTSERRFQADKVMDQNRLRNDETTASRRVLRDGNSGLGFAILLGILTVLVVGAYFILI